MLAGTLVAGSGGLLPIPWAFLDFLSLKAVGQYDIESLGQGIVMSPGVIL